MDANALNGFDPGRLVTFADIREAIQAANGITAREITEQASVRMNIEDNRYRELCNKITRLETSLLAEIHMLQHRLSEYEERLDVLENGNVNQPEYIAQLHEDMKWLHQRCDDIQRIFNFDTMIINGIQKQGE